MSFKLKFLLLLIEEYVVWISSPWKASFFENKWIHFVVLKFKEFALHININYFYF
jgi:hypothetical protein